MCWPSTSGRLGRLCAVATAVTIIFTHVIHDLLACPALSIRPSYGESRTVDRHLMLHCRDRMQRRPLVKLDISLRTDDTPSHCRQQVVMFAEGLVKRWHIWHWRFAVVSASLLMYWVCTAHFCLRVLFCSRPLFCSYLLLFCSPGTILFTAPILSVFAFILFIGYYFVYAF